MEPAPANKPQDAAAKARAAAMKTLAMVGFVALVVLGIALAIYSARYVPQAVNKLGSASAYLSGKTASTQPASLAVVPAATTTLSFSPATQTTTVAQPQLAAAPTPAATPAPVHTKPAKPALYGLPDLSVSIIATGYMTTQSTDSFVPSATIPQGTIPAAKFVITNVGTNASGAWSFGANIPSANGSGFNSPLENNLNPSDRIEFTLGFTQTVPGNQVIAITADQNNQVVESNENNNVTAANIQVW